MEVTSKMKKIIIGGLAGSALLIAGGIYAYQNTGYSLTAAEAQEIAYQNAGVSQSDVTYNRVEKDREDGTATYDVDFTTAEGEYSYTIDASTGSIMDRDHESYVSSSQSSSQTASSASSNSSSSSAASSSSSTAASSTVTYKVSDSQAKEIALKDAGLAESAVSNLIVTLDTDDGQVHYDVDFDDLATNLDYDYQINADTGAIMEKSSESIQD